jgi:hypothetical protein
LVDNFKSSMNLINREELKQKLDRGDKFKLINALGEWAFNAKRGPVLSTSAKCRMRRRFSILMMILLSIVLMEHVLYSKQRDEFMAMCGKDENMTRLFKQFMDLVTPGSTITGELNRLEM